MSEPDPLSIEIANCQLVLEANERARVEFVVPEFEVARGERVAIVGPSGSGKSTLLQVISGSRRPRTGRVRVLGVELAELSTSACDAFRGRHIGIVHQRFHLLNAFTALENVTIGLRFARSKFPRPTERARELLERVGIVHRADAHPMRLSAGEQQRLAIARAVASRPELILADEPTGSLDPVAADRSLDLLLEVAAEIAATLVIVTHDSGIAARLSRTIDGSHWIRREPIAAPWTRGGVA
jgi:predicted ABC-type transport system involved in lysophospholipase L1 biosynthesis ATPase subunit